MTIALLRWEGLGLWPLAVIAAIGVIALVAWLYPPQVRLTRRGWGIALMAMRTIVLIVLVLSLLKPVAARRKTAEELGAIVVLVDSSRSMDVVDVSRSPAQLVALADGLGQLPAGVREDPIAGLAGEIATFASLAEELTRADAEFEYARLSGRGVNTAKAHLADTSERFDAARDALVARAGTVPERNRLPERLKELAKIKPFEKGEKWQRETTGKVRALAAAVEAFEAPSDEQLYKENPQVREICDRLAKLSRLELVELALTDPETGILASLPREALLYGYGVDDDLEPVAMRGGDQPVRRLMLEPIGNASDLTGGVRAAIDRFRGHPVQTVLLFSDGRQVGGDGAVPYTLSTSGVPVISVATATRSAVRDVTILDVTLPPSQFAGETTTVKVELKSTGFSGQTATVTATSGEVRGERKVSLNDKVRTVEIPLKFETPGSHQVTIAVTPLSNETATGNNEVQRWIKVLSEKTHIAAFAGTPSWDYQYLRNALQRSPWVELTDRILDSETSFPLSPEEILELDAIILSDVSTDRLQAAQWDAVHQLVVERGGSLVMLVGDERLPGDYAGHVLLADLLPFAGGAMPTWRNWPGEEAFFRLVPPPAAQPLEALRLEDEPRAALQRWHALPGMYRVLPLPDLKPNARPLLVERDSGAAVLTESRLGSGRVFFMGTNETWRWRYKSGERYHDRFWLQLMRYASEEPYAATEGGLSLDVDRVSLPPGGTLGVRARVRDAAGAPVAAEAWEVQVLKDGEVFLTEPLPASGVKESGRFAGTISGLPVGAYEIAATAMGKTVRLPIRVIASDEAELVDLSGDEAMLRRLSASTGGEMLHLDELERLPQLLQEERQRQPQYADVALWNSPYLFLFVLACLAAEWALRKRLGLV